MNKVLVMIVGVLVCAMNLPLSAVKKVIPMPATFGIDLAGQVQPPEWIELDDIEIYSQETFAELIIAKQQAGSFFILARVTTRDVAGYMVHYFDAHNINSEYGKYPFTQQFLIMSKQDRINRLPIRDIDYFMISDPNAAAFEYLCSDVEVLMTANPNTLCRDILYSAQTNDAALRGNAMIRLEPQLAVIELRMPQVAVNLKFNIGLMYFGGNGVPKDYVKASQYFEQVEKQNYNPRMVVEAKYRLGQIYVHGGRGIVQDFVKSCAYFEQIANQNYDLMVAAGAKFYLGEAYYYGRSVVQDYVRARQYFEQIENDNNNLEAAAGAKRYLGEIYYTGRGAAEDLARARQYFEQVANQNDNLKAAKKARQKLDELTKLEAARTQGESSVSSPAKKQKLSKQYDE
jgi:TPR repeat protein